MKLINIDLNLPKRVKFSSGIFWRGPGNVGCWPDNFNLYNSTGRNIEEILRRLWYWHVT